MAHPIWKGYITFGLVNIPVTLMPAVKSIDVDFHLVDSRNHSRIHYERINNETGQAVPWDKVVKAYEYEDNNYVILQEEDLKKVAIEATQTIDIINFVSEKSVDYVYFDKPYYVIPSKNGQKGYALLYKAIKHEKKMGVAKIVIRTKQYLAALIPFKNILLLNLLRYNQEIVPIKQYGPADIADYKINVQEIKIAEQLIQAMTKEWNPSIYKDDYHDALMKMLEVKIKAQPTKISKKTKRTIHSSDNAIDFIKIIKQSIPKKTPRTRRISH